MKQEKERPTQPEEPPRWREHMGGRMIEPIELRPGMKVTDLVETYAGMGFNARRLAEACRLYGHMIDCGATIGMTVSGAMAPVGMGGAFSRLIEAGFVDWIIATGANLYHDLHRAYELPMRQGRFDADDNELYHAGIARIYDVYIGDRATLVATDNVIVRCLRDARLPEPISTADLHHRLGRFVADTAPAPDKSFVVQAMRHDVPIYTSSPGDSSIGINLIVNYLRGNRVIVDPTLDVLETAAIVRSGEPNGVVEIGGGSPKNFYLQTQPTLWQILDDNRGGHDYFVQFTTDSPQWGGLSGATPSEARSWGKVKDAMRNNVVVYGDATIAFPIVAAYVLETRAPRRRRQLFRHKDRFRDELVADYRRRQPHAWLDAIGDAPPTRRPEAAGGGKPAAGGRPVTAPAGAGRSRRARKR
jgi:deoxyhypusine synthase